MIRQTEYYCGMCKKWITRLCPKELNKWETNNGFRPRIFDKICEVFEDKTGTIHNEEK